LLGGGFLPEVQKRQVAVKASIGVLISGRYVKQEGMLPNYVILGNDSRVSRVNLVGVVVSVNDDPGFKSVVVDDGSGKVSARAFEQNASLDSLKVGDCVMLIGRPREFGGSIYVLPEIVRIITDTRWLEVRKLELARNNISAVPKKDSEVSSKETKEVAKGLAGDVVEEEYVGASSLNSIICDVIKRLDRGEGADFDAVVEQSNSPDAESTVLSLLKNGDIFEVSPGKLKVLE
jgi:RPA family protein